MADLDVGHSSPEPLAAYEHVDDPAALPTCTTLTSRRHDEGIDGAGDACFADRFGCGPEVTPEKQRETARSGATQLAAHDSGTDTWVPPGGRCRVFAPSTDTLGTSLPFSDASSTLHGFRSHSR